MPLIDAETVVPAPSITVSVPAPRRISPPVAAAMLCSVRSLPFRSMMPEVRSTALVPNAVSLPIRTSAPSITVVPAYVFAPFSSTRLPAVVSVSVPEPWITELIVPPPESVRLPVPSLPRSITVSAVVVKLPTVRDLSLSDRVPPSKAKDTPVRTASSVSFTEPAPSIVNVPEKAVVSAPNSNTPAPAIVNPPWPDRSPIKEPPATVNVLPMSRATVEPNAAFS